MSQDSTMKQHSIGIVQGMLTDYIALLEKEHPTAARLAHANANAAMRHITAGEGDAQVPGPPAEVTGDDETGTD